MKLLTELVNDVEHRLRENKGSVVEVIDLSEEDANYLMKVFIRYDVRRAVVISREDRSSSYTLQISKP